MEDKKQVEDSPICLHEIGIISLMNSDVEGCVFILTESSSRPVEAQLTKFSSHVGRDGEYEWKPLFNYHFSTEKK
jgi:hypothetical protein